MLSKKRRALAAAGVLAVCGCFGAAIATGVQHFRVFLPQGFGICENLFVSGNCTITYDADADVSHVVINMRHLQPNTTYGVDIDGDGSGFNDPIGMTTDSLGRATYTHDVFQDATPDTICKIYIWDGDVDTIDDVSDMEIRAVGLPQGFLLNLLK